MTAGQRPKKMLARQMSSLSFQLPEARLEDALRRVPFSEKVGVCGSYALWAYMCQEEGEAPSWTPGDCDIFVVDGSPSEFHELADAYLAGNKNMTVHQRRAGIVDLCQEREIGKKEKPFCISFVAHHAAKSLVDVVNGFDVNVCRVILRIAPDGRKMFEFGDGGVEENIKTRISPHHKELMLGVQGQVPADVFHNRFRAQKYEARGFKIVQGDLLVVPEVPFSYFNAAELLASSGVAVDKQVKCDEIEVVPQEYAAESDCWQPKAILSTATAKHRQVGSLRIATYNVWCRPLEREARTKMLIDVLCKQDADIICLQEVTQQVLAQLGQDDRIRSAYLLPDNPDGKVWARCIACDGIANVTLVKRGVFTRVSFQISELPSQMKRQVLFTEVAMGEDFEAIVACSHLESNPESSDLRKAQLLTIMDLLASKTLTAPKQLRVMCGDMNFIDGADEEKVYPGWTDLWQESNGGVDKKEGYTTFWGRLDRIIGYVSGSAKPVLKVPETRLLGLDCFVPETTLPISDHNGLLAAVEL